MSAAGPDRAAIVLETERLILRRLTEDDAEFMLGLLNEPSFHQDIGDRGVRTVEEARAYLRNGAMASYEAFGFGLWLVSRKEDGAPIGLCALLKRETLPDVDIGFALLPAYRGQGNAHEAAASTLNHGRTALGLNRIAAIVDCVFCFPGMDNSKENMVLLYGDKLLERGIAVLAVDGPGQAECVARGIRCIGGQPRRGGCRDL